MPLSDREQQILSEIESQLASDTKLANQLRRGPFNPARLKLRTGVSGMVLGLVMMLMIAFNPWGPVVAFLGFVLMLVSAVTVGNHLKGRSSADAPGVGQQLRGGLGRYLEGRRQADDDG